MKKRERKEIAIMSIDLEPGKIVKGAGGAILEDVPHITDWLPDLPVSHCFKLSQCARRPSLASMTKEETKTHGFSFSFLIHALETHPSV